MMNAIILAGGKLRPYFRLDPPVEAKALVTLLGRPMVRYVIEAARGCRQTERICIVAGEWFPGLEATDVDCYVPDQGDEADNLFAAIDALASDEPALMLAADVPLITSPMLDGFLDRCPPEADVVYTIVEKRHVLARFADRPGQSGTTEDGWVFVRLAEGEFTGSSLVYFRPEVMRRNEALLRDVLDRRRGSWQLLPVVGPMLALRAVLQQLLPLRILSWRHVERRMSQLTGATCMGLVSEQPEFAFDVDYPTDIEIAQRELRAQGLSPAAPAT